MHLLPLLCAVSLFCCGYLLASAGALPAAGAVDGGGQSAPASSGSSAGGKSKHHNPEKKSADEKTIKEECTVKKAWKSLTSDEKKARKAEKEKFVAQLNDASGGQTEYGCIDEFLQMDDMGSLVGTLEEEPGQKFGAKSGAKGKPVELTPATRDHEPELKYMGEVDPVHVLGKKASRAKRQSVTCSNYGFDVRTTWPACAQIINNIRDQSACGSCWAVNTASAFTDRLCVAYVNNGYTVDSTDPDMYVSALDIMQCSGGSGGDACLGGMISKAWQFLTTAGAVSGSNNTYGGCRPYPFTTIDKANGGFSYTTACTAACTQPNFWYTYASDKWWASDYNYAGLSGTWSPTNSLEGAMKTALQQGGSITASMVVWADFENYKGGIYVKNTNQVCSSGGNCGHAIRLIGYGTYNCSDGSSTPYWLGVNSWNTFWGEKGFFRIRRGTNEATIESRGAAWGTPWV